MDNLIKRGQQMYVAFYDFNFEKFKIELNTIFASFKNKNYLTYSQELEHEEKMKRYDSLLDYLTEGFSFADASKIYDIFYSKNIEEAYCYVENHGFNNSDFAKYILHKNALLKQELSRLLDSLEKDLVKYSSLNEEQKNKIKNIVNRYINKMDDFSNTILLLESDFIKNIEEIEYVDSIEGEESLEIEHDEELEKTLALDVESDLKNIFPDDSDILNILRSKKIEDDNKNE